MKKDENILKLITEIRRVLLTEAKNTDVIINTIGLPSEIAAWLTNDYPEKFQLWIADNFKKDAIKRISGGKEIVANIMIKMLKGDKTQNSLKIQLNRQKPYFQGMINEIIGWLLNRRMIAPETDDINLRNLSFEDAVRRVDIWQENVNRLKAEQITDESGTIIKTYPDGFYWIDLQTSNCSAEARAMNNCGRGTAGGTLYSFRKAKQSYLTGDVANGSLIQLRGRANSKPRAEYHDRIIDFLLEPKVNIQSMNPSDYRADANFELKDLNLIQITKLYSLKPGLFVPDELYKVILKFPDFATQVNFGVTPLHDDQKENLKRRFPNIQI